MEKWEVIERRVLLVLGCCLLVAIGWLVSTATAGRLVAAGFLTLCAYWAFWQALYEDRLGSNAPVTRGELSLYRVWTWGRRLILSAIAGVFLYMAFQFAHVNVGIAILVTCLGLMSAWVGWFGGGRLKSLADDRRVYNERKERYKDVG